MISANIYYKGTNGKAKKFVEEMIKSGVVDEIRAEKGNLGYEYFFSADEPEVVLLVDKWKNQNAINAHHSSPMMAKIAALRDKYDLQMKVERFVSDDVPSGDEKYIRK